MTRDSVELVQRMREGDTGALEELMQRHLHGLRGFVRLHSGQFLRAREESGDLVQSVCLEILRKTDRFEHGDEASFKRWLYVTALRKIKNKQRHYLAEKRDVWREVEPRQGADGELLDIYSSFCTPSREIAAREEVARIEAAFERLEPEYREVILLARIVGLSRAQIGEQMGRSEGAVRMLLSRATSRLTEVLATGN